MCGRLSGNCQNTRVYELGAGLENFAALDTERASTIHDIPYFNATEALLDKRRVVRPFAENQDNTTRTYGHLPLRSTFALGGKCTNI